ncbi:hypothetical protein [Flavobacterium sp. LHD-85]|uniref:hypothetical protein n=1 Tax=Flavobacterium sp. LHD-85 TaxID=3071410 RepID=UPI0027E059B6|nr:hypothetical protein [Flavobacterium sp. LHD-85]MDQ6531174.1 hypothetical protein [Flavobacterium sp. LHD-85]
MFRKFFDKKASIIEETNPDNISVENVRSFFNISTRLARLICKLAVRQGIFKRKFAVECKNESCGVINVYDTIEEIPEHINCLTCEIEGLNDFSFKTSELNIVEYYQYIEDGDKKSS